jgi:hypothetical protein
MIPSIPDRRFMQFCWVVPDIHKAIGHWTTQAGVGPFFLFSGVVHDEPQYRGQPTTCPDITAAIGQAGDVQIELVQQNDDRPSIWRDLVPPGQAGFHHAAIYTETYDADVAHYTATGAPVAFSGLMMGHPVCWIDTSPTLGFMIEVVGRNPVADMIFGQIRAAGESWDGSDPVRSLG